MNLTLAATAFGFIFLAALPGRTTFLMLLMAARGRALAVLLGAVLAFAIQAAISVALGNLFAFLPPRVIQIGVGLLLFYFAVHFFRDNRTSVESAEFAKSNSVRSVFLFVFAAEWGDVSQVAIASFSARNPERLTVYFSAVLALWLIAGMAVVVGMHLRRAINPAHIQKLAAVGFGVSGIYLVARGLLTG